MRIMKEKHPLAEIQAMMAETEIADLRKYLTKDADSGNLTEEQTCHGFEMLNTMEQMVKVGRESRVYEISMLFLNLALLLAIKPVFVDNLIVSILETIHKKLPEVLNVKEL